MSAAFAIVEDFEFALSKYTGAPHAVCVDSCTNALFLSLSYRMWQMVAHGKGEMDFGVEVPRHTYAGVPQAALNAGWRVEWTDNPWVDWYYLDPRGVCDSAKFFQRDMWVDLQPDSGDLVCVSFHIAKRLPLGQGGAILTGDRDADAWLRRARFDGRSAGETGEDATKISKPGYHMYMDPVEAARGLWLLEQFVDQPLNASWEHYPDVSQLLEV